jgi:TonB family protein
MPHNSEGTSFNGRLMVGVASLLLVAASTPLCMAQDDSRAFYGRLPESYARESAIRIVMPSYPEEAVRGRISGILLLKIEISSEGEVLRVKVNPHAHPLLKKAAATAAMKWQFKPYPDREGLGRSSLSRLTFMFAIRNGEGSVDLYNPDPATPDAKRLGYYNSPKELSEWRNWDEVSIEVSKPPHCQVFWPSSGSCQRKELLCSINSRWELKKSFRS